MMRKIGDSPHVITSFGMHNVLYDAEDKNKIIKMPEEFLILESGYKSLFDFSNYTKVLDEYTSFVFFWQLLDGLTAIHEAGIAHLDIKENNVILVKKEELKSDNRYANSGIALKITDFGIAKI